MANIGVDVYLKGGSKGGQTSRAKSKLSTSQSRQMGAIARNKSIKVSTISSFITGGDLKPGLMLIPGMGAIMAAAQTVNQVGQFGIRIHQAHSGEDMLASNMSATLKAYTSLGTSVLKAGYENILFNRPQVRRQNYMLEYGRNLYLRNIENEKNSFG